MFKWSHGQVLQMTEVIGECFRNARIMTLIHFFNFQIFISDDTLPIALSLRQI